MKDRKVYGWEKNGIFFLALCPYSAAANQYQDEKSMKQVVKDRGMDLEMLSGDEHL